MPAVIAFILNRQFSGLRCALNRRTYLSLEFLYNSSVRVKATEFLFILLTDDEFKVPKWSSPNGLVEVGSSLRKS